MGIINTLFSSLFHRLTNLFLYVRRLIVTGPRNDPGICERGAEQRAHCENIEQASEDGDCGGNFNGQEGAAGMTRRLFRKSFTQVINQLELTRRQRKGHWCL